MRSFLSRMRADAHVGVSVGSHRVNLARVARRGGVFRVEGCVSLPAGDDAALRRAIAEHGWRGLPATLALRDQLVHRRVLNLPAMGAAELRKLIAREIAAEGRDGRLAAWKVEATDGGNRVVIRAVERPLALEWTRRLREAGLLPHHILARATAFANATLRPEDRASDELISLLDVWERESDLVLVRNGEQIYHRHIGRGWDGTEFDTPAPALGGTAAYGEVSFEGAAADPAPQAEAAPDGNWERLAEEIRRTHLFAKKNLHAGEVARAVLTGPADEARRQWLAGAVGTDVLTLAGYRADLAWDGAPDPHHVLPVGAALRGFARRPPHERLIPADAGNRKAPATRAASAALAVCLFALALMGVYNEARAVSDLRGHVANLRQDLARIEAAHPGRQAPTNSPLEAALTTLPAPFPGSPVLAVLGRVMPEGGRLTALSAEWDGAWRLELDGRIDGDPVAALRRAGRLIADLKASGLFAAVDLQPMDADRPGRFRLRLTVEAGA